uniref:RNA pseudouridine synthase D3 n=2 Tax=Latimeria chalumnae TaxID=7897 RepID=H3ABW8_LATCH|nr:PREDICTED: RNA pseudouridylate synthase domain-containing protein 3 [Latimeria chalumnae]|eukprot:XP_014353249.1 PREDICTED: RNA pseudouridylate synthase domain-containing protein 3 [Latimeria chalumnae]
MNLKLCSILGDHVYSTRVGKVLGVPVPLPVDMALPQTQVLEEQILRRMRFTQQQMHRMPLHLHLHRLAIPAHGKESAETVITAPPPLFFIQTLKLLGLSMK